MSARTKATLSDQPARERFVSEVDKNFSVIAPAGVGKTRAIVERVVSIATNQSTVHFLPRLTVVTYTNKAADEMQQRARNALLERPGGALLIGDFNRAFFGTIHSFCMSLLQTYGHYIGLPGDIEMITDADEDAVWTEFFRQFDLSIVERKVQPEHLGKCLRHIPAQDVLGLARKIRPAEKGMPVPGASPDPDFEVISGFESDKRNMKAVAEGKEVMEHWRLQYQRTNAFLPLPSFEHGGAKFKAAWKDAFAPLCDWLSECSLAIAHAVAAEYKSYRISSGTLTYADQVNLVHELLLHPEAGPLLKQRGYRIILDEAQDTDPDQFAVLLELAGREVRDSSDAFRIRPGHFCMVGDPQQSIYGSRADLNFYRGIRKQLAGSSAGKELEFHVTFRCDRAVTAAANLLCPEMLNGADLQVEYVTLRHRPDAALGQTIVRKLPDEAAPDDPDRAGVDALSLAEAEYLAEWMASTGHEGLQAPSWDRVAVLCARKRWIEPIELSFATRDLPVQNHSRQSIRGDDPFHAWLTALTACTAEPLNSFEIVGVLREVFGISDHDLFEFSQGDGSRFQISETCGRDGIVGSTLDFLRQAREEVLSLPLLDGVRALLSATRLRERVASLDDGYAENVDKVISSILARAAESEAEGQSLADWAETLVALCDEPLAATPVLRDSIQLMTCHAAKGLEWDAVIIPFLGRSIASRGNDYPYVYESTMTKKRAVFSSNWLDSETGERIKRGITQENQRLLYVAMTRARHSLVLVDDTSMFGFKKDSFAACLGIGEDRQSKKWHSLSDKPCRPARAPEAVAVLDTQPPPLLPIPDRESLNRAVSMSQRFPSRTLPHALAKRSEDAEPESILEIDPEWTNTVRSKALLYGTWWHEAMENIDWSVPDAIAKAPPFLNGCPDAVRAHVEWDLLLRSDMLEILSRPGLLVRTEVPFLRNVSEIECVEGAVDLIAHNPEADEWLVIDWKTNVIERSELPSIGEDYAPQLREYAEAVRSIAGPGASVSAAIYSTACGTTVNIELACKKPSNP